MSGEAPNANLNYGRQAPTFGPTSQDSNVSRGILNGTDYKDSIMSSNNTKNRESDQFK